MNCAICNIRRPRRFCPGVSAEICAMCCGTEREETVDCPMRCEYLRAAHLHEKPPDLDPASVPNSDIQVSEEFVQQHQWLLGLLGSAALEGARKTPGITDYDLRAALQALIQAHRGEPDTEHHSAVFEAVQARLSESADVSRNSALAMLAFLQGLEYEYNNGRKRSRAFCDFLTHFHVGNA